MDPEEMFVEIYICPNQQVWPYGMLIAESKLIHWGSNTKERHFVKQLVSIACRDFFEQLVLIACYASLSTNSINRIHSHPFLQ